LGQTKATLPLKNTLLEVDARALEAAYQVRFEETTRSETKADLPPSEVPVPSLGLQIRGT
jgi:hypothetical protein